MILFFPSHYYRVVIPKGMLLWKQHLAPPTPRLDIVMGASQVEGQSPRVRKVASVLTNKQFQSSADSDSCPSSLLQYYNNYVHNCCTISARECPCNYYRFVCACVAFTVCSHDMTLNADFLLTGAIGLGGR